MEIRQTCPRRMNSWAPFEKDENLDTWHEDNTCSFCGSLNPAAFMERLERGDIILGPTDKSYKVYVKNNGGEKFKRTYRNCYAEIDKEKPKCTGPKDCTHWVTRETDDTKFYFQHLSEDKMVRFIELLNGKKLNIGYPGYFYSTPYFITYNKPKE